MSPASLSVKSIKVLQGFHQMSNTPMNAPFIECCEAKWMHFISPEPFVPGFHSLWVRDHSKWTKQWQLRMPWTANRKQLLRPHIFLSLWPKLCHAIGASLWANHFRFQFSIKQNPGRSSWEAIESWGEDGGHWKCQRSWGLSFSIVALEILIWCEHEIIWHPNPPANINLFNFSLRWAWCFANGGLANL